MEKRKHVFIGLTRCNGIIRFCALLPKSNLPETAATLSELAFQQAISLGKDWREKIDYNPPAKKILAQKSSYELIRFEDHLQESFDQMMVDSLSKIQK